MHPPIASLMQSGDLSAGRSADERRLSRLFRAMDAQSRQTLLSFADFLSERSAGADSASAADQESVPLEPLYESRPAQETVVAAIRRLRRVYPMVDTGAMLNQVSSLMSAHVLQGRSAETVIDELEVAFEAQFDRHRGKRGSSGAK